MLLCLDHPASVTTRPLHILLVDDNPADLTLAQEAFAVVGGQVMIRPYQDGEQALRALREITSPLPDVVLLDVNMPGLGGFEVLSTMKSDPQLRSIPVVMMTTANGQGDVPREIGGSANPYLLKSVDWGVFMQAVQDFVQFWMNNRCTQPGAPFSA